MSKTTLKSRSTSPLSDFQVFSFLFSPIWAMSRILEYGCDFAEIVQLEIYKGEKALQL